MPYDFEKQYAAENKLERERALATNQFGTAVPIGTRAFGDDPNTYASSYQEDVASRLKARDQAAENATFDAQKQRILGAMQPSYAATQQARADALQSGAATLSAARSQGGVGGMQTSALAALGAGQAQQYGMQAAAQVQAAEEQRNAVAQAQLAEMLRQQQMAQLGLERADYAQILGAQRALLPGQQAANQQFAASEAERQRQMTGASLNALGSIGGSIMDAYSANQKKKADEDALYAAQLRSIGFGS